MGMYDRIIFEDIEVFKELKQFKKFSDVDWQTKSFDCLMDTYIIDKDGLLFRNSNDWGEYAERIDTRPKQINYHGIVNVGFYSVTDKWDNKTVKTTDSVELHLWFNEGKMYRVEVVECELNNHHERMQRGNMLEHIKNVINVDTIEAPKSFQVYGFTIKQKEGGSGTSLWSVQRVGDFYIDMYGNPTKEEVYPFITYQDAYEALKILCEEVQSGKYDNNEILTRRPTF